jgi:hypothetical protein
VESHLVEPIYDSEQFATNIYGLITQPNSINRVEIPTSRLTPVRVSVSASSNLKRNDGNDQTPASVETRRWTASQTVPFRLHVLCAGAKVRNNDVRARTTLWLNDAKSCRTMAHFRTKCQRLVCQAGGGRQEAKLERNGSLERVPCCQPVVPCLHAPPQTVSQEGRLKSLANASWPRPP